MRRYTDADRVRALATLQANGGNAKRTARELGIPRATVRMWREHGVAAVTATVKTDWLELMDRAVRLYLNGVIDEFDRIHGKDRAIVFGILADKHMDYRDGRKGDVSVNLYDQRQQVVLAALAALPDDELRRALLAAPEGGERG